MAGRCSTPFGDMDNSCSINLSSGGDICSATEGEFVVIISVGDHESIFVHSDGLGDHSC